ncbi:hypothetical protein KTD17_11700 [Burkholderia multivorans]|uniref:hypothetical protein n=1 Tax=Burkholderia multivorans TaxID=87883 RepID=UPI001C21A006|nr:hypothetical protein [Burkholderia multivorans]MBU9133652.1 hypothetical protein [Burkholderia multivorans]
MRKLRCKVGDLAIVTKCGVPERIGILVRIVASAVAPHDWVTEVQGAPVWARQARSRRMAWCREALCHDWNLTPIRGELSADDMDAEQRQPERVG